MIDRSGVPVVKIPKPKILLITSRTGGGHISLSHALAEMLSDQYETTIADPNPGIIRHYYTWVGRHFLSLWGLSYKSSDNPKAALRLHKMLTLLVRKRLITLIEQIKPCLIITTHTLLSYEVARAIERSGKDIPLIFQFSELEEVHATWVSEKNAAAYLVPTREIYVQAQGQGIDPGRLYLTGMPVRKQFLQDYSTGKAEILASLALDPTMFTVFLQGGAEGASGIDRSVNSLLSLDRHLQIIMAVGTNKSMASRFSGIDRLNVLPFTENIAPYMAAADVIVGKAGPNAIAETVMLGKPFLATSFIPGQEEPNLAFLERYNLGWACLEAGTQRELMAKLLADPALVSQKIDSVRTYRSWNLQANQLLCTVINRLR
jgi:UDP-N-acetylglucosamine:LPS N-acetylglucosamine transferase